MLSQCRTNRIIDTIDFVLCIIIIDWSGELGLLLLSGCDDCLYECQLWIMVTTRCVGEVSIMGSIILFVGFRTIVTYLTVLEYGGTIRWIGIDRYYVAGIAIPFWKLGYIVGVVCAFHLLRLFFRIVQLVDILLPIYICNIYIDHSIFIHPPRS